MERKIECPATEDSGFGTMFLGKLLLASTARHYCFRNQKPSASSVGLPGSPEVLRTRVAAPSVCFAVACILLAAAPTAPPCFRRWRQSSPLPPLGELSAKQTERFLRNSAQKEDPLSERQLREGVFFCFGEMLCKVCFCTFIICHPAQKSSGAQKVYKEHISSSATASGRGVCRRG